MALEHLIFHHNGREYKIYDVLTIDEIHAIAKMNQERDKKLNPFNARSTKKYFDDTDKMIAAVLRKCLKMTDKQIADIETTERRYLASSFINFLKKANSL